jgi:hypothetical protein
MNFSKWMNYSTDICWNGQGTTVTKSSIVNHNLVPVQGKISSPNPIAMESLFPKDIQQIIKLYYKLVPSSNQNSILKSYTDKHRPPKDKQRKLLQERTLLDCGLDRISFLFKRMEEKLNVTVSSNTSFLLTYLLKI